MTAQVGQMQAGHELTSTALGSEEEQSWLQAAPRHKDERSELPKPRDPASRVSETTRGQAIG